MNTPRDSDDASAPNDRGAFSLPIEYGTEALVSEAKATTQAVKQTVKVAKVRWAWAQKTRPYRAFSHFTDVSGAVLAAGMSYQAVFAVFAALWVCFGVLGIWISERTELLDSLVEQINSLVPGLLGDNGIVSLNQLLASRTLDLTSIIAGLALAWVTLNWFTGTRRSIRIIFGLEVKQYRNAVLLKLRDLALAMVFLVALVISAALTVFTTNITDWLLSLLGWSDNNWLLTGFGVAARYALLYLFDVLLLIGIVYYLAEIRVDRWEVLRGCLLGAAVLLVLKFLGAELLGGASRNPLLASFTVFVGLLLWFNFVCRTLLLTAAWIATGVDRTLGAPNNEPGRLFDV